MRVCLYSHVRARRTNAGPHGPRFAKATFIMKDQLGLYYHPQAGNAQSRVYVRRGPDGEVEFRLWRADHPEVWERHPWLSMAVVRSAARMYQQERKTESDPTLLYDIDVARALLQEDEA